MGYSKAVKNATEEFFKKYGADMIAAITDTELFFPAVFAQKALESGWGKSHLAANYNNFGGIKNFGSLPNAGVINMDTTEVINGKTVYKKQPFATYATPKLSFQSYVKVLQDPTKKYTKMGVFTANSPEQQILRMAEAGYTTTPPKKYLAGMQSIIDAVRDIYQFGKISTSVTEPTVVASASSSNYMDTIKKSLGIATQDNTYIKPTIQP